MFVDAICLSSSSSSSSTVIWITISDSALIANLPPSSSSSNRSNRNFFYYSCLALLDEKCWIHCRMLRTLIYDKHCYPISLFIVDWNQLDQKSILTHYFNRILCYVWQQGILDQNKKRGNHLKTYESFIELSNYSYALFIDFCYSSSIEVYFVFV